MKILIQAVQPKLQIDKVVQLAEVCYLHHQLQTGKVVQLAEVCYLHHHCERLTSFVKQDL